MPSVFTASKYFVKTSNIKTFDLQILWKTPNELKFLLTVWSHLTMAVSVMMVFSLSILPRQHRIVSYGLLLVSLSLLLTEDIHCVDRQS